MSHWAWLSATVLALALGAAGLRGGDEAADTPEGRDTTSSRPAVLLELFTSEGCSSCPPADRLLEELAGGKLVDGVEIVPLSLHVDYWNHLGWRDPYSSADFSQRQDSYAASLSSDVFTPQLVVDGSAQVVGSDRREALATIARAAKVARAAVKIETADGAAAAPLRAAWRVTVDAAPLVKRPPLTYLFVAVTEDGLQSSVAHGENAGKTLHHTGVVRTLRPLGRVWLDQRGQASQDVTVDLDRAWQRDHLHLVAWIADGPTGRVLGSARVSL
jgi:hypothetical protein